MPTIASWNVNSLRVRLNHLLEWLDKNQPDVLALQETKVIDSDFPAEEIKQAGYHVIYTGQKTYNGVALLSRIPFDDVAVASNDEVLNNEKRIIRATVQNIRIINVYVPNGESISSLKYSFKLDWLARLKKLIAEEMKNYSSLVVLGDFNIAPADIDVHDPLLWKDHVLVSDSERQALQAMFELGLQDTFRLFEQPANTFSWWDYRAVAFRRNHGLRIDLILATEELSAKCSKSFIDKEPRKGERPSDHTPVVAVFS